MQTGNKNKQERQVATQTGAGFLHSKMQIKSHRRIIQIINIIKTNKPLKSVTFVSAFLSLPIISKENKEKVSRKKNVKITKHAVHQQKSRSLSVIQFS